MKYKKFVCLRDGPKVRYELLHTDQLVSTVKDFAGREITIPNDYLIDETTYDFIKNTNATKATKSTQVASQLKK